MQKLTSTELGWVLCAIDAEIYRYEQVEKNPGPESEKAFAKLRREGMQNVYGRLRKAHLAEDRRIAVEI